jgi:hypothetical protein
MDNWLVKMAQKQETSEERLRDALGTLPIEELQKIAGDFSEAAASETEAPAPKTTNMDRMQSSVVAADQMGRELAHRKGDELMKRANVLAAMKPLASKALGVAAKNPMATMAGVGAAGGAVAGGPNNRMGGALTGAALGAAASKIPMGASNVGANLASKAQKLSTNMAPGPFAQGGSVRNAMSDIGNRLRGAFGGATKVAAEYGEAEKAEHQRISRGHGRVGGVMGGLGGGVAGGIHGGPKGALLGAAAGAAGGYGMSYLNSRAGNRIARAVGGEGSTKVAFPGIHKMDPEEFESRFMSNMDPDKKEDFKKKYLTKKEKTASSVELMKLAYSLSCGPDGGETWIKQFEGTPLLPQALELEKESIQSEMEDMQRNAESTRASNEQWQRRDQINMKKRLLALTLAEQSLGGAAEGAPEMGAQEMPPEAVGAEGAVQPPVDSQVKVAMSIAPAMANIAKRPGAALAAGGAALGAAGGAMAAGEGNRSRGALAGGALGAGAGIAASRMGGAAKLQASIAPRINPETAESLAQVRSMRPTPTGPIQTGARPGFVRKPYAA